MYLLRSHLLETPNVVFYYKGTAREEGVPFALNTIVAFEPSDALGFESQQEALSLCNHLNIYTNELHKIGCGEFIIVSIQ